MKRILFSLVASLALAAGFTAPAGAKDPSPAAVKPVVYQITDRNPLTYSYALALHRQQAARKEIAWGYVRDGCYARAHLMMVHMQNMVDAQGNRIQVEVGKVWSFEDPRTGDRLHVTTSKQEGGYVEWGWHVAPTVPVTDGRGGSVRMVIDPSLFDRPVSVAEWRDKQKTHFSSKVYVELTRAGQAPAGPLGEPRIGCGYLPSFFAARGLEPKDVTAEAWKTMAGYKKLEKAPTFRGEVGALGDEVRKLDELVKRLEPR